MASNSPANPQNNPLHEPSSNGNASWIEKYKNALPVLASKVQLEPADGQNPTNMKLTLDFSMPLVHKSPSEAGQTYSLHIADQVLPKTSKITHLHLKLDVTHVVRLEQRQEAQGAQAATPGKPFTIHVTSINDATLSDLEREQTATAYRYRGIYPALELLNDLPDLTHLDLDVTGTVPANAAVKDALTTANMATLMHISQKEVPRLRTITMQIGRALDRFQRNDNNMWILKASSLFDYWTWPDVYDLTRICEELRAGKGIEVYPNDYSRELEGSEAAEEKRKETLTKRAKKKRKLY